MDNLDDKDKRNVDAYPKDKINKLKTIFIIILSSIPLLFVLIYFAAINSPLAAIYIPISTVCGAGVCLSYVLLFGEHFLLFKKVRIKQAIYSAGALFYDTLSDKSKRFYNIFYFFMGCIFYFVFLVLLFTIKNNLLDFLESLVFFSLGYLIVLLLAQAYRIKKDINNMTKKG